MNRNNSKDPDQTTWSTPNDIKVKCDFMQELHTEIAINATTEVIWELLTDLNHYSDWNPFITTASGKVVVGEKLKVYLKPPNGRPFTFTPTVNKVIAQKEFRWLGHLLFRGLFDGEHIYELHSLGDNQTRFIQREQFRGVLVPIFWKSLSTSTRKGFEAMNQAIKERAEALMSS